MDNLVIFFHQAPFVFLGLVAVISLCVGSFLNVLIHRLPLMLNHSWRVQCLDFLEQTPNDKSDTESVNLFLPRSRCPHCKHQLSFLENIPLLSYLFLMGKCRQCLLPIHWRYPATESLTMATSLYIAYIFGPTLLMLTLLLLTWGLLALLFIDLEHQLLPDNLTLPLLWLGLLVNCFYGIVPLFDAVMGAMAGYMSLWLVAGGFKLVTGREGMGHGDFKLFALFGAWLGWQLLPFIILLASLLGAIIGSIYLTLIKSDKRTPIPFGPYLVLAGWLALLWGKPLLYAYSHWVFH